MATDGDKGDIFNLLTFPMVKQLIRFNSCTEKPASTRPGQQLNIWGQEVEVNEFMVSLYD
jgi:hypothetical protein